MENRLAEIRAGRGWSQAEIAERIGLSRQGYAAIESGRSVPSTEVALKLARLLDQPVESLFRLEGEPLTIRARPVEGAKLGGRVRIARMGGREVAVPLPASDRLAGPADGVVTGGDGDGLIVSLFRERPAAPTLLAAGCDPAFGLAAEALRVFGEHPLWLPRGSGDALRLLAEGSVHIAGAHLAGEGRGSDNSEWVARLVPFPCTRITFAVWEQTLLLRPGNPRGIGSVADLVEAKLMLSNREEGSGSRMLLDAELGRLGIDPATVRGYETRAPGHLAVAEAISSGLADGGIAIRAAGAPYGLHAISLRTERYELIIPNHFLDLPSVQRLLELLGTRALRLQVEALPGYDASEMGVAA